LAIGAAWFNTFFDEVSLDHETPFVTLVFFMTTASHFTNLRSFLDALRLRGELVEIDAEVDPRLEISEIHRRVIAAGGPALLFKNVKGKKFPLVCNMFGTRDRVDLAFGEEAKDFVRRIAALPEELLPPSIRKLWGLRDLGLDDGGC